MEGGDQSNPCAICLGGIGAGGQAIFTAECSHTFHFNCISKSVAHGHLACPLCKTPWRELPCVGPAPPAPAAPEPAGPQSSDDDDSSSDDKDPPSNDHDQVTGVFNDDEQLEQVEPPSGGDGQRPAPPSNGALAVKTHAEYSAIARGSAQEHFAVLVHLKAPTILDGEAAAGDGPRAPLDLVTVLDVSGSMSGQKLALLKQAMGFVIDNLGADDRLSVVAFSSTSRRETRLLRMSDTGKALATSAVESLVASGGTNIAEGLRTAAKVLDERRHRNAVSSVILLSDGQDNYTMITARSHRKYEALVPASLMRTGAGDGSAPIHTFGFGNDHDAAAMHVIAEASGGTFSYIENESVIQDAFAQCIGGLLTVVVQEARVAVACVHPGVRITSVKSGRYESRIEEDGRSASIHAGELYADEQRRFLLFLAVPAAESTGGETETALIKVDCSYRDAAGGADVNVTAGETVVSRPEQAVDAARSLAVSRERARVAAAEDIAAARAAAERGAHQVAVRILEGRQRAVEELCDEEENEEVEDEMADFCTEEESPTSLRMLGAELQEMGARVTSRQIYARSGRAYMLAGMSMHEQQRANSRHVRPSTGGKAPMVQLATKAARKASFVTPAMERMVKRSRTARGAPADDEQQEDGDQNN